MLPASTKHRSTTAQPVFQSFDTLELKERASAMVYIARLRR
ncbi:hypothetical protein PAMC26577_05795 [Caballeronia sordidicola]|uniref:Uncharacterized protein n=1 Tax=Caballeronia sordidicola TaxID=196367 RepID=A0A242N444_CABSO|nr:hypothetical protein PAMC26577_05795 [Caballeronia sordidicola]